MNRQKSKRCIYYIGVPIRLRCIGEIIRRINGKSVMTLLKGDVTQAAGALQVCAGQDGGCKAAIHAFSYAGILIFDTFPVSAGEIQGS